MKTSPGSSIGRALARFVTSAVADRYEPEVASELDPVDGVHSAAGEGELGSNPAPGTRPWIAWRQALGDPECPYLVRWVLDLRLFSIRLHHWIRSDDKRAMHDHSWWFITLVLRGGYTDWVYDREHASPSDHERMVVFSDRLARVARASRSAKDCWPQKLNEQAMPYTEDRLTRGSIRFRPAHHVHTVAVDPGGCWTLMLTGRFARKYGFYVRKASGLLKFRKANKYFSQHGHHPCDQL